MKNRAFIGDLLTSSYIDLIHKGLDWVNFGENVTQDTRVFIKPNLTFPEYRQGVMTSPQAIEAAILAIKDYTSNIYVGDADSGGYNRFSMDEVYDKTGIRQFASNYGAKVVNLSKLERTPITFAYRGQSFSVELPTLLTDEVDFVVTMPVPKIHMNTGVSLTFKNQWGCIPEPDVRLRLHPYFKHVILEVNKAIRTRVAIIDGAYGLNVSGPLQGSPVELNWLLVTSDIGTGAVVACKLMQISLDKVAHLKYAKKLGYVPDFCDIEINQDIQEFLKEKFFLKRAWTDLPGVLAFNHAFWAYVAYHSPIAGILHKMLYLFREPFYEYGK